MTYVLTDHWGNLDLNDATSKPHAYYRNMLHDAKTDKTVGLEKALDEAVRASGAEDGDEIMLVVVKTGRRPFGNRRVRYTEPHTYKREPG